MMVSAVSLKILLRTLGCPGVKALPSKVDVLLVRHDLDCGYSYNGYAYSHILDSISDVLGKLGKTRCTVATPYSSLVGEKAYGSPFCINRAYALATIAAKLKFCGDRTRQNIYAKKNVWRTVIKAVSPKVIIGIAPGPELCWAANEMAVPVYDIQHGVINDGHAVYKYVLRDGPDEYVPTGFLCWDSTAADTLEWARARGKEVHVVGNPWFQRFIHRKGNDTLVEDALSGDMLDVIEKKTILVTMQWGLREFFKDSNYYEFLPEPLIQAINKSKNKYNWLLRLHPVQVRSGIKGKVVSFLERSFGREGNVFWEWPTSQPLPQVLAKCDLHITDCGSTTIEASWYGIPTALLNNRYVSGEVLADYFVPERACGLAVCVPQETSRILEWVSTHERVEAGTWVCGNLHDILFDIVSD
ncbi:hypothetical protein [Castellaniella denitrificans]|uniref:Uncharacterized protein n=1 Tax=Castellaniella denitrificans TaxID=56119 RepID=A0ABT4LZV8_9BURK|nr:hypothetical protein [Castellaniella denitrificans]MCZ4328558.1 hypothetical protein [Castellaniella denitrificans]